MVKTPKWKTHWPEFETLMKDRLQAGFESYGDGSFDRKPSDLLEEATQELLDLVGWGFILWTRVHRLRKLVEALEKEHGVAVEL